MHHPAFELKRQHTITALNLTVYEYEHTQTKASHYHFESENPENVFLAGFRTVPMDDTGVAHILEHTALCGSKKYPVRDPFFMMIRRSLNTFMNAFTSNDWTAYPFASTNRKDFFNLLDVYLDACFFANLNELDFLQEGHRLEFSDSSNTSSDLEYKGVVFNEMKGAMSSISSTLWQTLCKHLFTETTYHYNSGGEPADIPSLSFQQLKDFYQTHYHPSNAMFATFGNIDAKDIQTVMHEQALKHFEPLNKKIAVGNEPRLQSPKVITEHYAFDDDDIENQTHLVMGWLLGQNTSLKDLMEAQLLSYVLFENSACPLQHYLETTELGSAPSPLCGMEDSYKELIFCCGIQGADNDTDTLNQFTQDVFNILNNIVNEGIPLKRLEAIAHQLELSQREITGDGYPFGLQIILNALPCVTHRGDPIELLDLEPVLAQIRQDIQDPNYIKSLVKELLVDNAHKIELCMKPDPKLSSQRQEQEKQQLASIQESLSEQEKQDIVKQAEALAQRQAQEDDISILPKVELSDVPKNIFYASGETKQENSIEQHNFAQGTNGISYQQLIFKLPEIEDELLDLLPLYGQALTELGLGEQDFLDVQHRQSEVVGNINGFTLLRTDLHDHQKVHAYLAISAKALNNNIQAMSELILDTATTVNFDNPERIKDLITQQKVRKLNSISGSGHSYAMMSASSGFSAFAQYNENVTGLSGVKKLKALESKLENEGVIDSIIEKLKRLHQTIILGEMTCLNIADPDQLAELIKSSEVFNQVQTQDQNKANKLTLPEANQSSNTAWICNTQVNFCAKAYPTVPSGHEDAPALTVLGGFLRNGFLHTAIREKGGAYGAGATQDSNGACFKFYSYRDPRIAGTLDDFNTAIEWLLNEEHTELQLEEAILGVIGSLDKPSSPAGEAKHACHNYLFGRSKEQQQAFRQAVLNVKLDDLQHVAKKYLQQDTAAIAIVTSETGREEVDSLTLDIDIEINTL